MQILATDTQRTPCSIGNCWFPVYVWGAPMGVNLGISGSRRPLPSNGWGPRVERNWKGRCQCAQYAWDPTCQHIHATTQRNPTSYRQSCGHLTTKALGFSRFLVNVVCMEKTLFFYDLDSFGSIRSTQPTMPWAVFSKIDTYGVCMRRNLTGYATKEKLNEPALNCIRYWFFPVSMLQYWLYIRC